MIRNNIIRDNTLIDDSGEIAGSGAGLEIGTGLTRGIRPAPLVEDNLFLRNVCRTVGGAIRASHFADGTIIGGIASKGTE